MKPRHTLYQFKYIVAALVLLGIVPIQAQITGRIGVVVQVLRYDDGSGGISQSAIDGSFQVLNNAFSFTGHSRTWKLANGKYRTVILPVTPAKFSSSSIVLASPALNILPYR